jgi:2-aminoadipate transaminase
VEEASYGGTYARLARCGVRQVPVALDGDGIRMDHLERLLEGLAGEGVRPKFLYTIPSVQNPTGSVMSRARRLELLALAERFDVAIFEDDCYADLVWEGERPPTIRALDDGGRVVYCGSFSKTVAPALRIGYLVADWPLMRRLLPLKTDAGTGALAQMVLARFLARHFDPHVQGLVQTLEAKCRVMTEAVAREFGTSAEFTTPKGGIFLWVTLPEGVDTTALAAAALAEGVAINPGAEWSADPAWGRRRMRLCFGHPSPQDIREGVAKLAEVCHREFGVPVRSANVAR